MKDKTLFVFGAGFSYPFIPTQANLLTEALNYNPGVMTPGFEKYREAKGIVRKFINEMFLSRLKAPIEQANISQITLEDIFTILDKAISRHEHLNSDNWTQLVNVRNALNTCVVHLVTSKQNECMEENFYTEIVYKLNRKIGPNNWSCIGLNWDTLWDHALSQGSSDKYIDYGFSAYHIQENGDIIVPNKEQIRSRYLKLHGSFNWLTCPRCHSLFVSSLSNIGWRGYFDKIPCGRCRYDFNSIEEKPPIMETLFLTPTIIKELANPYLNICWNEALFDLEVATEIIFVGYSFPLADHEFRYLLRKGISKNTKIQVVLGHADYSDNEILKQFLPPSRYKSFFGLDESCFHYCGYMDFFNTYFQS